MNTLTVGTPVIVDKIRNGYFVGIMTGIVVCEDNGKGKVKIETSNGRRWYSIYNVNKAPKTNITK